MDSSSCIIRKSIPWIAVLTTFSAFASFSGYGVFSILVTFLLLILSTIFLTSSKEKLVKLEETVQEEALSHSNSTQHHFSSEVEQPVEEPVKSNEQQFLHQVEERDTILPKEKAGVQQGFGQKNQIHGFLVRSPDLYSESESVDQSSSSEDSDIDRSYSGYLGQSPEFSDDSISDEESLIEIALPSGHYVGSKLQDPPKYFMQQKLQQDFSSETIFHQPSSLMELLAEINEMNEEENLIEIDLSMGSIKCSRFEIEA